MALALMRWTDCEFSKLTRAVCSTVFAVVWDGSRKTEGAAFNDVVVVVVVLLLLVTPAVPSPPLSSPQLLLFIVGMSFN